MIFKFKYVLVFAIILTGLYCFAQTQSIKRESKDIYGKTLTFYIDREKSVYFRENGEIVLAYNCVEFNGGYDSLTEYLNEKLYTSPKFNHREYNALEFFYILFNENLEIIEVRIAYNKYREIARYNNYDSILIDALKNTNGMWHKKVYIPSTRRKKKLKNPTEILHKTVENKEWYLGGCSFYIY